ncbi:unnamed protein product [Spodoptera exigua]|nr:unnamed protein product [Spodoptera exigua]
MAPKLEWMNKDGRLILVFHNTMSSKFSYIVKYFL